MPFIQLAKNIANTVPSSSKDDINRLINEAITNDSIVFAMLSIGYATHYLDHDGQDRFLEFVDSSAEDKTPALELVHTALKGNRTRLFDQLEILINSKLSIRTKVRTMFWAIYLSDHNEQSIILRSLESFHK